MDSVEFKKDFIESIKTAAAVTGEGSSAAFVDNVAQYLIDAEVLSDFSPSFYTGRLGRNKYRVDGYVYDEFDNTMNLIIADYICRGINSPKVWRKYLDSFEERYGSRVVYCKAKSKEYGWRNLTQKVILENGKAYYETRHQSNFTKGYLRTGVFCRPSCYDCKFKGYPRIADITLADFWGIENINTTMEKDLGTSLVMINSKKGERFFESVKQRINYIKVPFECIEAGNRSLNQSLDPPKVDRNQFFKDLDNMTFLQISEKYIDVKSITPMRLSVFGKLRAVIQHLRWLRNLIGKKPSAWYRLFRYNTISEIRNRNILVVLPHCVVNIDRGAIVKKQGVSYLGRNNKFRGSKLETRLFVGKNATLELGDGTIIGYGSDVEVFPNAHLVFGGAGGSNINLSLICGEHIEIGRYTMIGRDVTIRDNNGGHYLNRPGYRNTRPIKIGEKAWLCEKCTIMPGVKIGDGGIVGACALVTAHVPQYTLVSGNPAHVVDEDILWKY